MSAKLKIAPMYCLRSPNVISSLSNKLDQRGHLISFFMPKITIHKLSHFNIHLHLISFIPFSRLQWTSLSLSLKFLSESSYLMVFYDFIHRLTTLLCIKALHNCTIN
ncbi:putative anthocyanidin 3-O-glucoside 2''-O-glucosyltransferase [Lupinus albus]|uniref:Putative anthocyanidin 3-O-glucoside 2''-O-glucosyltransferase n=1 Tax=Lupinus albus TaxID=3870 RepID=A0A6A4P032_LUPAL|nr:putative anthocyanidin 3-O-glucoside 2''-O-glucosyltransferase [Lupinus albus]